MTVDPTKLGLTLRLLVYLVVAYVALFGLSLVVINLLDSLISTVIVVAGAALLANLFTLRIFERGKLADIGLGFHSDWWRHFGIGVVSAAIAGALTVFAPMALGLAHWTPTTLPTVSWNGLAYTMLLLGLGVIGEELFFRGYGLQVALPVVGKYAALLPMGAWFALAHSGNLNVGWLALFNTFAWGVVLGWAVLRSGDLWLAIGLHAGWNWVLPLLGVNLSGFTMKLTGYDVQWGLADIWSGGDYGPEGGLLCTLVVVLLVAALWRIPMRPRQLMLLRETGEVSEGGSAT